jgi:ribosome-binding factor A
MGERRLRKAASVIGDFVSNLFVTRVSDPRLRALTVTRAKVSHDMRRAYIFYSVIGGEAEKADVAKALGKAAGFVRASLAEGLSLRFTPEVVFLFDKNPGYAQRVMDILATDPHIAALRGIAPQPASSGGDGAPGGAPVPVQALQGADGCGPGVLEGAGGGPGGAAGGGEDGYDGGDGGSGG